MKLVTVFTTFDSFDAWQKKGFLEGEGIPTLIKNEAFAGSNPLGGAISEEIELLVEESDADKAREILEAVIVEGDELTEAPDRETCPECGSRHFEQKQTFPEGSKVRICLFCRKEWQG